MFSLPNNCQLSFEKPGQLACVLMLMLFLFFGNFQVTWIRHRDVHILTVGEYTYTTDERFVGRHTQETDEWVLIIKYVQERDAGIYECQIPAATPKSYPVNLNIVGECLYEMNDHIN